MRAGYVGVNRDIGVNDVQPFSSGTNGYGGEKIEITGVVAYLPMMIQRVSIIAGWLALGFIVYATLSPIADRPAVTGPHLEHFAAFGLVGLAFALAYPSRLLLIVVIVVGSAFGLEALQLLTPDRHGRVIDALVKAAGGICGISVGQLMSFLLRTRFSHAKSRAYSQARDRADDGNGDD
jgi:VanZ family protein